MRASLQREDRKREEEWTSSEKEFRGSHSLARIYADVAADLCTASHDVCTVGELSMARADDAEILEVTIRQRRILVTLDDDLGDWAVPANANCQPEVRAPTGNGTCCL